MEIKVYSAPKYNRVKKRGLKFALWCIFRGEDIDYYSDIMKLNPTAKPEGVDKAMGAE